jgi:hypothetical protein
VKDWSMRDIYRGMYDFMVIQVLCVALVLAFPQIAMWFPGWLEAGDRLATPLQKDDDDPAAARNALEAGDALTNDAQREVSPDPQK